MYPDQIPQQPSVPTTPHPQGGYPPPPSEPLQAPSIPDAPKPYVPQTVPGIAPQPSAQFSSQRQTTQAAPMPGMPGQANGPGSYAVDYLDQIAPPPSRPKLLGGSFTWILIGMAVLFMFAVGIISLYSGKSNTQVPETLYLRYYYLLEDLPNYQNYIKNNKLSSNSSNFILFMTTAENALVTPLATNGLVIKSIPSTARSTEKAYDDAITARLENARLNATLDQDYANEMAYQTQVMLNMYKQMAKSNSVSIRNAANAAIPNLTPIQKSFADFNPED